MLHVGADMPLSVPRPLPVSIGFTGLSQVSSQLNFDACCLLGPTHVIIFSSVMRYPAVTLQHTGCKRACCSLTCGSWILR